MDIGQEPIATLAIIDLETNDLPTYQFNQCGITELSIFAFSADCINCSIAEEIQQRFNSKNDKNNLTFWDLLQESSEVPKLPRIMHKLTLMVNPLRRIANLAEKITGNNLN